MKRMGQWLSNNLGIAPERAKQVATALGALHGALCELDQSALETIADEGIMSLLRRLSKEENLRDVAAEMTLINREQMIYKMKNI